MVTGLAVNLAKTAPIPIHCDERNNRHRLYARAPQNTYSLFALQIPWHVLVTEA